MEFPQFLNFTRDNTTAQLKEVLPENKKNKTAERGVYEYISGFYFKGKRIEFSLADIEKLKNKGTVLTTL